MAAKTPLTKEQIQQDPEWLMLKSDARNTMLELKDRLEFLYRENGIATKPFMIFDGLIGKDDYLAGAKPITFSSLSEKEINELPEIEILWSRHSKQLSLQNARICLLYKENNIILTDPLALAAYTHDDLSHPQI